MLGQLLVEELFAASLPGAGDSPRPVDLRDPLEDACGRGAESVELRLLGGVAGDEAGQRAVLELEGESGRRLGRQPLDQARVENLPDGDLVLVLVGRDLVALQEPVALEPHDPIVELDDLPIGVGVGAISLAQLAVVAEDADRELVALGRLGKDKRERAALDVATPFVRVIDLGQPGILEPARQRPAGQAPDLLEEPMAHQLGRLRQGHRGLAMTEAVLRRVGGQVGCGRGIDRAGQPGLEPGIAGFGDRCLSQLGHCPEGQDASRMPAGQPGGQRPIVRA